MKKCQTANRNTVIFVMVVFSILLVSVLALVYKSVTKFQYTRFLDEECITTSEGGIKLRDVSYYFMMEEESVNEIALTYDEENPKAYWGLYIDNTFVNVEAKETAINYCIRDILYANLAGEEGMTLSEEELQDIKNQAEEFMQGMTERQKELGMTEEDLIYAMSNQKLANNYVIAMAKKDGLTMSEEVLSAYYGLNSKFYKNLKKEKKVSVDSKMMDNISLGSLTIN